MGYDEQVLRQNGIPVGKYKLSAYILGSFFFAVAALLLISRQGLAVSNMGNGRDFAFKKKSPILPIIYETKRGIKIRNKNYSFFMYKQSKRTPFRV